jgi:hypothetical protein
VTDARTMATLVHRGAYPLLLGRAVLNRLHLYLSNRENLLYFTD